MAYTREQCSYGVIPTAALAKQRSQLAASDLGCDLVHTLYWWEMIPLTDGTVAIRIEPDGPFGPSITLANGKTHSLTQNEIKQLVPWSAIAGLVPQPPPMGP